MVFWRLKGFFLSCLAALTAGHMINYSVVMYAQEVIRIDWLAGVGFGLCFGPPLVLGWYAGVLCDRLAPGRLMHGAHVAFVGAVGLLALAHWGFDDVGLRIAALLAASALTGAGWSFASPARMAALGQVARIEDLKPASIAFNLLVMLGFGLGPVCIAVLRNAGGWPAVLTGAVALFAFASLALTGSRTRASGRVHQPVAVEIREGVSAVTTQPLLRQLMLAATAGFLGLGPMTVLLPKLAAAQLGLGELQRGAFLGTLALSLIAGGMVAMIVARYVRHGWAILAGTTLAGAALAALGGTHDPRTAMALLGTLGVSGGASLSLVVAGIQTQAAEAVRGRVLSMYTITSQAVPAAAGIAAGALVQTLGVGVAMQWFGTLLVAIMMMASWRMGALRTYRG
jgi:MFS family permease